jgi:hypothetical protein
MARFHYLINSANPTTDISVIGGDAVIAQYKADPVAPAIVISANMAASRAGIKQVLRFMRFLGQDVQKNGKAPKTPLAFVRAIEREGGKQMIFRGSTLVSVRSLEKDEKNFSYMSGKTIVATVVADCRSDAFAMMGRELSDLAMQAKSRVARTELMEHLNDLLDDGQESKNLVEQSVGQTGPVITKEQIAAPGEDWKSATVLNLLKRVEPDKDAKAEKPALAVKPATKGKK